MVLASVSKLNLKLKVTSRLFIYAIVSIVRKTQALLMRPTYFHQPLSLSGLQNQKTLRHSIFHQQDILEVFADSVAHQSHLCRWMGSCLSLQQEVSTLISKYPQPLIYFAQVVPHGRNFSKILRNLKNIHPKYLARVLRILSNLFTKLPSLIFCKSRITILPSASSLLYFLNKLTTL